MVPHNINFKLSTLAVKILQDLKMPAYFSRLISYHFLQAIFPSLPSSHKYTLYFGQTKYLFLHNPSCSSTCLDLPSDLIYLTIFYISSVKIQVSITFLMELSLTLFQISPHSLHTHSPTVYDAP